MQDEEKNTKIHSQIQTLIEQIYELKQPTSEINQLREGLNASLMDFDGSKLQFDAQLPSIDKIVRDSLKVYIDDGVLTEVQDKGHGLQRYFMVALFKLWANKMLSLRQETRGEESSPINNSVYFAIEEPELFLHPQYQRLMKRYLQTIADTPNNQVFLNTHSPNFIDFDHYQTVGRVVKEREAGYPATHVIQPIGKNERGELVEKELVHYHGKSPEEREKWREVNFLQLSYYMDASRCELFFANRVVLVEGETEKLMFQRWAEYFYPEDPELLATTTYIDMGGKFNAQIFQKVLNGFRIPYVIIVDDDSNHEDLKFREKSIVMNNHMKEMADQGDGFFIELLGDFEAEFGVIGHQMGLRNEKKNKPFIAYSNFYNVETGGPIEPRMAELRKSAKLKQIFGAIYQKMM